MHLNDEMFSIVGFTINVKDAATQIFCICQLLFVLEGDIPDMHFVNQQVVQETNQQVFAEFLSEEAFEAPIGKGVNIFTHGQILR